MPPGGEPAPADGALPPDALDGLGTRPFGVYVHVPFCATRCGYCDFNTYTASDLGLTVGDDDPASPASWLEGLRRELDLGARVLRRRRPPRRHGVRRRRHAVAARRRGPGRRARRGPRRRSGSPPARRSPPRPTRSRRRRSCSPAIADAGYTRLSLGMQSDVDHVLAVLDRRHTPGAAVPAASAARDAGLRTSTSTSSTARPPRPTTTCAAPSTPSSPRAPTTSRPTRSSSRRAPRWPAGSRAASCRCPTTTSSPTATRSSTTS